MNNNQICDLIGWIGLIIAGFAFTLYFFGYAFGLPTFAVGVLICVIALINYD